MLRDLDLALTRVRLGSASEAERFFVASATHFVAQAGLDTSRLDALSGPALHNVWVFHRLTYGPDDEVEHLLSLQPAEVRDEVRAVRARNARDADERERIRRRNRWIAEDRAGWDRLSRVPEAGEDLVGWLSTQTPDTWHAVVEGWNWDHGYEPLDWIARQPTCDRATAVLLFLAGGAEDAVTWGPSRSDAPPYTRPQWDHLHHLATRLANGGYPRSELQFHPSGADAYLRAQAAVGDRLPWPEVPAAALAPTTGRAPDTPFYTDDGVVRRRVEVPDGWRSEREA